MAETVTTTSVPSGVVTYADIKNAVFYSQQKPELLADIIADVAGVEKE